MTEDEAVKDAANKCAAYYGQGTVAEWEGLARGLLALQCELNERIKKEGKP